MATLYEMCCFNLIRLDRSRNDPVLSLAINELIGIANDTTGADLRQTADLILLRMEEEARKLEDGDANKA